VKSRQEFKILLTGSIEHSYAHLIHFLEDQDFLITRAASGSQALELLQTDRFNILFSPLDLADMSGKELMVFAKTQQTDLEIFFLVNADEICEVVDMMMAGGFACLPPNFNSKWLEETLNKASAKTLQRRKLRKRHQEIRKHKGIQFIGQTPAIVKLKSDITEVAQIESNVLITGETGTGKELVASTIHALSKRSSKRFLPINCSALTEDLMLNELFGHEKEAFTGASKFRTGLFESANGGCLLLDEIGELPMVMQAKLLRVLQEKQIIRVGGTKQIDIDVRILAATNRDLQEEVQNKNFRQDLFYRLNVVSIEIPPLRWRRDDIPLLIHHFLSKYQVEGQELRSISPEAMEILVAYDYPGNVRELENIIERSLAMCRDEEIRPFHLPAELGNSTTAMFIPPLDASLFPEQTLAEHERKYILSALNRFAGNKTRTAKLLGIDRVSLWRKLKRYQEQGFDVSHTLVK